VINLEASVLQDLTYSSQKEFLLVNQEGTVCNTSVSFLNTRKYHGLYAKRLPELSDFNHIYIHSIDEVVKTNNFNFELGCKKYASCFQPSGYKFLHKFSWKKNPQWIYKLNNILFQKEIVLNPIKNHLYIAYTNNSNEHLELEVYPFSSFREIHQLTFENPLDNLQLNHIDNGFSLKQYPTHETIYLQWNTKNNFSILNYWHSNLEYSEEKNRGYNCYEDVYICGKFNLFIPPNETVVLRIADEILDSKSIEQDYKQILNTLKPINNQEEALVFSAQQFISKTQHKGFEICAGFPWFGRWGRDTFIALPGLMKALNQHDFAFEVIDAMVKDLKNGLFTNIGIGGRAKYNSADASLYFFWTLQHLSERTSKKLIWEKYQNAIKNILSSYKCGTFYNIHCSQNGLLYAGDEGVALTWMDAVIGDYAVTPRRGWAVDLIALWYNAICFSLELAIETNDMDWVNEWKDLPNKIQTNFVQLFWDEKKKYLADVVNNNFTDWSLRPNQIFALSLPYPLITEKKAELTIDTITQYLLTPKGLKTLSANHTQYKSRYEGGQLERDLSYHQGIVWPWLLGNYADALIKVYGESCLDKLRVIWGNFEEDMYNSGIYSISEIYDAEEPYLPKGTISQAWSVSELLRIKKLIDQLEKC
jgi:predicted glycogen debranching enzyme